MTAGLINLLSTAFVLLLTIQNFRNNRWPEINRSRFEYKVTCRRSEIGKTATTGAIPFVLGRRACVWPFKRQPER